MTQQTTTDSKEYFQFLDRLRESGAVNMFDSSRVLMEVFDLKRNDAREIVIAWMQQFGKNQNG